MIKGYAKALAAVLCFALVAVLLSHSSVQAVTQIAPCTEQGQATGCVTPQVIQRSVCDNNPGLCKPPTANVVYIACGASLATISGSSPAGTIYQLGGNATSPCTYSAVPAMHVNTDITIQGDCSSPVGANTIIDGGNASNWWLNGSQANGDNKTGVTIKCLTVQHFYPHVADCLFYALRTYDGWTVRNSTIKNNGCVGILQSGASQLINNLITLNGMLGIFPNTDNTAVSGYANSMLVQGNEVSFNGFADNQIDWGSANIKIAGNGNCPGYLSAATMPTQGIRVLNNYVHDSVSGPGIWTDCWVDNTLISGNTVLRSFTQGIFIEISAGIEVSHNVMNDNNIRNVEDWKGCMYISTSTMVDVHDNYCAQSTTPGRISSAIWADITCRNDPAAGLSTALLGNYRSVHMHHNTVVMPLAVNDGGSGVVGGRDLTTANSSTSFGGLCVSGELKPINGWALLDHNTYYYPGITDLHWHIGSCATGGDLLSLAQMQAIPSSGIPCADNGPGKAQEVGSTISGLNAAGAAIMARITGCTFAATSGKFCDQQPPPW